MVIVIFTFYTEDGEFKLDYDDYLKSPELMARINDDSRLFVNLGLRILSFSRIWLSEHPSHARFVEHMQHEREENPLRFFLPHCARSKDFDTPSHRFINDDQAIYTAMIAPNRLGKTTAMWIKMLTRYGLIECDPNWEIFKEHGVKYQPYGGPREVAVVTYLWDNWRETLWPKVVRAWSPKFLIKDYLNWNVPLKTTGETLLLAGELKLTLKACSQPQTAFESGAFDGAGWDEQGVESKFDGMDARMKTRRKWWRDPTGSEHLSRGFHVGALTPHKVEGRPDTGSGTWLHRMCTGEETRGLTTKFYQASIMEVPDWVFSERQKQADMQALDEAERRLDRKRVRQIRSRIFGEWESSSGAVFDEYDEEVHVVDDFEIPAHWCAFRAWDHGRTNPTACVNIAISPEQDYVIFRDYMGVGNVISANVEEVVRRCGNTLEQLPDLDLRTQVVRRWKELPAHENYIKDILDGHTFKTPDNATRMTIGDLYRACGLTKVQAAAIGDEAPGIMLIKELLKINPDRKHMFTGNPGAPRLYIMRSCRHVRRAMVEYANKPMLSADGNLQERPQDKKNHIPDAMRYGFEARVPYMPECPFKPTGGGTSGVKKHKEKRYSVPEDERRPSVRNAGVRYDSYTGYPI